MHVVQNQLCLCDENDSDRRATIQCGSDDDGCGKVVCD